MKKPNGSGRKDNAQWANTCQNPEIGSEFILTMVV